MHIENLSHWTHEHVFDTGNVVAERSTRVVMWITVVMTVVEIVAGLNLKSADTVRERLSVHEEVVHATIEVHRWQDAHTASLGGAV